METFEIVMLGNTSVGKTSMLAVLNQEVQKLNSRSVVTLESAGDTTVGLNDAWIDLQEKIAQGKLNKPVTDILTETDDYVEYKFNLCFNGEAQARVEFIDTKGKFIRDIDGTGLLERTSNSIGAFCVIDAAVLMECDAGTNARFNRPGLIRDLLGKVFARETHPKFVAFILTKCEKYMQTKEGPKSTAALKEKFHKVYADSIDLLRQKHINSYAMAIQTLGCVWFKDLDEFPGEDGRMQKLPRFKKISNNIESHDCGAPLIMAMKNILWIMENDKSWWERVKEWLGFSKGVVEYIK